MEKILSLKNISKKYQAKNGEIIAIENISFDVEKGEFVSIIGPSGCGKSTLLSIISGLEEKNTGNIFIDNEEVIGLSPKIGYMLQKDSLLEWRTIYDNVIFGLEVKKIKNRENEEYVINLLKKYGLYEFKDKYPTQLSGLDYQTRIMVTNDIFQILKNEQITVLMVTHDISEGIF